MAQATGMFDTVRAIGEREDLQDVIFDISPTETPFLTRAAKTTATGTFHEWQTDALASAALNAQIEGDDVAGSTAVATTRLGNYLQISRKDVVISGTLEVVSKAGRDSELAYQIAKIGRELKRDMEVSLTQNQEASAGGSATARQLAAVESWLSSNKTHLGASGTTPGLGTNSTVLTAPTDGTQASVLESHVKSVISSIWTAGGNAELILVGSGVKQDISATFSGVATKTFNINSDQQASIIAGADVYVSDFGNHSVVPSRFSRGRTALLLDMDFWAVATLRPIQRQQLAKSGDSMKEFLITEYTLVSRNQAASGKVADITT